MKTSLGILLLAGALLMGSCSRPKTIPDEKLEEIFKEFYLANAYCNQSGSNCDSADIYRPILDKYGYKPKDMTYTLSSFTKRKSSRLSDIIDAAIKKLESEYNGYKRQVDLLDTIEMIAGERYKQVVYTDSLIRVRRTGDTSWLRITLPAKEGSYKIEYGYLVDSTDKNSGLRTYHQILDSTGYQVSSNTNWMRNKERQHYQTTLESPARGQKLVIRFANYSKNMTDPDLRIDSLTVTWYLPKKTALDSLDRKLNAYKLLIDGKEYDQIAQDSLALRIHPPRVAEKRDSVR